MTAKTAKAPVPLVSDGIHAVNVGVVEFALAPRAHGATVTQLDWRPPAAGDRGVGLLQARLEDDPDDPLASRIVAANARALDRILAARPMLADIRRAADTLPALGPRQILHAGPPIEWARMCGPMRGAVIGAILYEGWADAADAAEKMADRGQVQFAPCHHFGAVGPMAGILSPSMPVVVVENAAGGNKAFATLNEGLGKVLRFGAYSQEVLDRLKWMGGELAPALGAALRSRGPVDLKNITAQALQMGDECHNRNVASTSLFARLIAPALVRTATAEVAGRVLEFLEGNNHFFLNLSMAACKATLDSAHGIADSTVVTAMARNGVEVGVRMSGTNEAWFTAPAIVRFVGGSAEDALNYTRQMYGITLGRNADYGIPSLGFAGTPTAIDARRVVDSGVAPVINTGIAHKDAGIGQIGAGIARAPLAGFSAALAELGRRLGLAA